MWRARRTIAAALSEGDVGALLRHGGAGGFHRHRVVPPRSVVRKALETTRINAAWSRGRRTLAAMKHPSAPSLREALQLAVEAGLIVRCPPAIWEALVSLHGGRVPRVNLRRKDSPRRLLRL